MQTPPLLAHLQNLIAPGGPLASWPQWLAEELQRRVLGVINHVLSQEPEAMRRLARQAGRRLRVHLPTFEWVVAITPAGLFDAASPDDAVDLVVRAESGEGLAGWLALVQSVAQGGRPTVKIEGDVLLAAEIAWVVDHVSWDVEADLARVVGDEMAHTLGSIARRAVDSLRGLVGRRRSSSDGGPS